MNAQTSERPDRGRRFDVSYVDAGTHFRPRWDASSEALRKSLDCRLDLAYGPGARDRLDFFPAKDAAQAPTVIFIHGGYWQRGDKSGYSYIAQPFVKHGVSCITLNYDLCPGVRIGQIVAQVQSAVKWIWHNAPSLGVARDRLNISGHSAGGHLSAMMMATDWPALDARMPADALKSGILISGVYDVRPLAQEPGFDQLHLDAAQAQTISPLLLPGVTRQPRLLAYGEQESDIFHQQSLDYAAHLSPGVASSLMVKGCNHFQIMDQYASEHSELFSKALALVTA
jgi:arylformamidase